MTAALQLAADLGLSIFPVGLDKRPLNGMSWKPFQERNPTAGELDTWLSMDPPAWAVICGKVSGLVVLDFDGEAGAALLNLHRFRPHVLTPSGGFHQWFVHPGWRVPTLNSKADKANLGAAYPGLDIRADGGYAVFAGGTAKGEYRWLRPMEPDPLDRIPSQMRAVLNLLHAPKRKRTKVHQITLPPTRDRVTADTLITGALGRAAGMGRNCAGFWLAIQARDNGYAQSEDWIMRAYQGQVPDVNVKGEREPFTEREALQCWRQAFQRAAREPWARRAS